MSDYFPTILFTKQVVVTPLDYSLPTANLDQLPELQINVLPSPHCSEVIVQT
jgi:hypothetical protein